MEANSLSLFSATLLYNGIIVALLGLVIYWFRLRAGWLRLVAGVATLLGVTLILALVMCVPEGRVLRAARLLCYGWFVHVPLFLLAACVFSKDKMLRAVSGLLIAASIGIVVFCFRIEPFRLEVTHYYLKSSKVDRELEFALLADFQTDEFGEYQEQALRQLMEEKPDAIFMAGDYLQSETFDGWEVLRDRMNAFLHEIHFDAPLGCYGVGGNTDFRRWPQIFSGLDTELFSDTRTVETDAFVVTGYSVIDSFGTDVSAPAMGEFHVALGHAPDFSLSSNVQADLLLAGHTHGGQVRLPLIGPVVTFSAVPRAWAAGMTRIDEKRTLVVSRGVGMERRDAPRLRFLCRPELAFIHVLPE